MCLDELVAQFREKGFVIAPEVFDLRGFDAFTGEVESIIKCSASAGVGGQELDIYYEADGKTVKKCERILHSYPDLKAFVENNEKIKRFMGAVFGEGFVLFKDKLNPKYAGDGSGWKMHVDGVFYSDTAEKGWWDYASEFVNILIAFDQTSLENGALQIRPIDHDRCSYEQLLEMTDEDINGGVPKRDYYQAMAGDMVPLELEKGDVAFFDPRCYHMSTPNKSGVDRKILYLTYNKLSEGDNYLKYYEDKVSSTHLGDHASGDWQRLRDE